jgi:hypothetical protein
VRALLTDLKSRLPNPAGSPTAGQKIVHDLADFRLHFCDRTISRDDFHAPGLAASDFQVPVTYAAMEGQALCFKPSVPRVPARFAAMRARQGSMRVKVENNRQVGLCLSANDAVKRLDCHDAQLAAIALVRERSVVEAVAHHDLSPRERWLHHFCQVLCPSGIHQGKFGEVSQVVCS